MSSLQKSAAFKAFSEDLASESAAEQAKTIIQVIDDLPAEKQTPVVKTLADRYGLSPDQPTSNKVWLIIIWAFSAVMMIAVLVLSVGVFLPTGGGTKPETMLTVFTTVTAFLAGLFAPSPVSNANDG